MMNEMLEYKGYLGSVEYSSVDEIFYGRIIGISDRITFDGDGVKSLKRNFEEAVDDYLESCAELGKEPEQPYRGYFDVRISPELHKKLVIFSTTHKRSLNTVVEEAIRSYVV